MQTYLQEAAERLKQEALYEPHPILRALMLAVDKPKMWKEEKYMGIAGDIDNETGAPTNLYGVVILRQRSDFKVLAVEDLLNEMSLDYSFVLNLLEVAKRLTEYPAKQIHITEAIEILNAVPVPQITFGIIPPEKMEVAVGYFLEWYATHKAEIPERLRQAVEELSNTKLTIEVWRSLLGEIRGLVGKVWSMRLNAATPHVTVTFFSDYVEKEHLLNVFDWISQEFNKKFLVSELRAGERDQKFHPKRKRKRKKRTKRKKLHKNIE